MAVLTIYEPADLKRVYRALKDQLLKEPDLMDSEFLQDLQAHLQFRAAGEGVDLRDHAAWARWLDEPGPARGKARPKLRLVTEVEGHT
jgi:hypothetical protein